MKKSFLLTVLISLIVLFFIPIFVQASIQQTNGSMEQKEKLEQQYIQDQIENLGLEEMTKFWDQILTEYGGFLPESQKGSLYQFIKGEKEFSLTEWFQSLVKFLFYEILTNGKLLGTLILLTVFSTLLEHLQNAFEQKTVSKVAYMIVYMVLIIIALNSFHIAISYTKEAIQGMTNLMLSLIPLLLAMMASSGGLVSAAFFHPVIIFLMNTSGLLIEKIVLPLLFLSALLYLVSTLSEHYKVTQLAQLLKNISIGLLGSFLTVFLGVLSVQGASAAVTDGLTLRTAKFVTGNFVPVLGKMFTDAADTVISASLLLKNTVGLIGVALVLMISLFPAIKVLALAFIYKLSAAILQPLGGGLVIECLDIISKCVVYIFAALAIVSLMFFLSLTVIIAAGNVTMMVR
ncbi:stage III sporulation protein AE [Bacillus alveayuensis]|uniref:Stage III sporulation protein AE n=1 Tax=Aeribacillus alveayuensis TaxID=279215 RepID=A0ABT9VKF4_9BACI|nr:stage III sporulation protein AE [Bacillus alveayuensis]MDQ0161389.1 stage III sporulation protein AE [Bacillus alveayuensis]